MKINELDLRINQVKNELVTDEKSIYYAIVFNLDGLDCFWTGNKNEFLNEVPIYQLVLRSMSQKRGSTVFVFKNEILFTKEEMERLIEETDILDNACVIF